MPVTIRPATCLLVLGVLLLFAGIGLIPTVVLVRALESVLRDVIPPDPLLILLILVTFLLWPLFSVAALFGAAALSGRREDTRRQEFEKRPALTDEDFALLLPDAPEITLGVRAELERFIGGAEVAHRLLPSDPVRNTCARVGIYPDDLDWVEFLCELEARFGVQLPNEAFEDATVAQLIRWCAGEPKLA